MCVYLYMDMCASLGIFGDGFWDLHPGYLHTHIHMGFPDAQQVKSLSAVQET